MSALKTLKTRWLACVVALLSTVAFANADNPFVLGVFPGTVDTSVMYADLVARYDPLARYLEAAAPKTKVAVTVTKSPAALKEQVRARRYSALFVNPEIAAVAAESGYRFTAARAEAIVGVVLTPTSSGINEARQLAGKTITANREAMVTTLVRAHLLGAGIDVKWMLNDIPQGELPKVLEMGFAAQAIVVRKEFAARIMEQQPGKWLIAAESSPEHGFVVGFRGDVSEATAQAMTAAFASLTPGTPSHDIILAGFDAGKVVKSRYVAIDNTALIPMQKRLRQLGLSSAAVDGSLVQAKPASAASVPTSAVAKAPASGS